MTTVHGDWLDNPAAQAVLKMLEDGGHQAYAVGGCVRNALLGAPVADVDIATDAHPERVVELAEQAGLRPVPTGIDHGTITVVADGTGFEVTTFRADVETDGRRAVVAFATDITEDARRRDFTMNALYADRRGQVLDPLGVGVPDLNARRLRFIEDAETRIREDYLRILRFFRFFAWYGNPEGGMDAEALSAIAGNLDGLDVLSRERVGHELMKLFAAPDPLSSVCVMARSGVLNHVLPGTNETPLGPLLMHEVALDLSPDPLRRLAVLGMVDGAALRLSKAQQRRLRLLQDLIPAAATPREIAYRHGEDAAREVIALRAATFGAPLEKNALPHLRAAADAEFPVKAKDLQPALKGPALGEALRALEADWIASGFSLTREALLSRAGKA
ncbi:CCA tRNA nucleotidyltransferase [Sagittula salina]|uniref:CCA tRNA nucleotidyltransferase n=1 Tax=Sagittula salina TaxID=2820268 RepID=A0A940S3Q2_9RHOB|nr:CCA tRNA nucleotidyltransferase [Sagittula salina]MBP0483289.1 CCA tRNA nucleotidyltransferase [Sagittula salina]